MTSIPTPSAPVQATPSKPPHRACKTGCLGLISAAGGMTCPAQVDAVCQRGDLAAGHHQPSLGPDPATEQLGVRRVKLQPVRLNVLGLPLSNMTAR